MVNFFDKKQHLDIAAQGQHIKSLYLTKALQKSHNPRRRPVRPLDWKTVCKLPYRHLFWLLQHSILNRRHIKGHSSCRPDRCWTSFLLAWYSISSIPKSHIRSKWCWCFWVRPGQVCVLFVMFYWYLEFLRRWWRWRWDSMQKFKPGIEGSI